MKFGDLIKQARESKGLSARELSKLLDLSPTYISKVESGSLDPTLKSFAKIVYHLGLNKDEVMLLLATEFLDAS